MAKLKAAKDANNNDEFFVLILERIFKANNNTSYTQERATGAKNESTKKECRAIGREREHKQ